MVARRSRREAGSLEANSERAGARQVRSQPATGLQDREAVRAQHREDLRCERLDPQSAKPTCSERSEPVALSSGPVAAEGGPQPVFGPAARPFKRALSTPSDPEASESVLPSAAPSHERVRRWTCRLR